MQNPPVFEDLVIGYCPMFDVKRAVMATRLTVFPLRPQSPPPAADLLQALAAGLPGEGGSLSLNVTSESMVTDLLQLSPAASTMIEVPAFMATEPAHAEALTALKARGTVLLLKGRPLAPLPPAVRALFRYQLVEPADRAPEEDRRVVATQTGLDTIALGATTAAEAEAGFQRGARAVCGWPMPEAPRQPGKVPAGMKAVMDLIQGLDREEPADRLEGLLKREPTLAFRLMRYINSPAFGLSVEITSFRHAIMILGYQRMKRWLSLLLATATDDPAMRPLMFAAVRRGLMMEALVRAQGEEALASELFICGVFSLLDRVFGQPFATLLANLPVPDRVMRALAHGEGPYQPYLDLAVAVEQSSLIDIRAGCEALMVSAADLNGAVLHALAAGQQLA